VSRQDLYLIFVNIRWKVDNDVIKSRQSHFQQVRELFRRQHGVSRVLPESRQNMESIGQLHVALE
jgi:hypothetical protein